MLVRAYRLTDRMGVVLLKSSVAFSDTTLAGIHIIVSALARVLGIVFGGLFALIVMVLGSRRAVGGPARRASGSAARTAGAAAGGVMARRAARAQMEVGLAEDPLRVQNRVLSGILVVVLVALLGVVLWATSPARRPAAVGEGVTFGANNVLTSLDETPAPGATAVSGEVTFLSTPVPTATPLPELLEVRGSLAYVASEGGQKDIWAVNVGSRTPIRLTNNSEDDRDPAWSPDGRRLAYASRQDGNWEIYIYDVASGSSTRMTYDLSFQAGPQWSPDGEWLVYESYQGDNLDIYVMPVDNSRQPERITSSATPDFSPSWSPDGRRIAFVSWRDGNQDVYVFSLDNPDDAQSVNITNTVERQEDYPSWSPDGEMLAYSAVDEGIEKVFVKPANNPGSVPQVIGRGRAPTWSPDGPGLVFAVDSSDSTHLYVGPVSDSGVATEIIPAPRGASDPTWTVSPLPPALVNGGGLPSPNPGPLYVEQEARGGNPPFYQLNNLGSVAAPNPFLSDRVNDSFDALRQATLEVSGWDFLGQLEDAFWRIDRPPQPGEERRNWHMTGRAFALNRNAIVGFPAPIEIVREDSDIATYWRVFVRVADEAQSGQLGEPLRQMPWDFASRDQGDVEAYDQGGRIRSEVPTGYYIDFTELAAAYGWTRIPAGTDWRGNFNSTNYWDYQKRDGLAWLDAMLELYTEPQLGGFAPSASAETAPVVPAANAPAPVQQAPVEPIELEPLDDAPADTGQVE